MFDNPVHIFDLDGTVIDSRHRYASLPNGDIDLPKWIEKNTPENIMLDTLLPRAATMRQVFNEGFHTIICTARQFQQADFDFLERHNLLADAILFRPTGVNDGDADLKEYMLDEYLSGHDTCLEAIRAVMYEDNISVIQRLRRRGVLCSLETY
jgi:phosphoglycolate phosphatase-like HAD superfamily hydrolase